MTENIREIVLDTLLALERENEYSDRLIKNVLDKYDYLETRDKAFIKRLAEGTLERKLELDYYLSQISAVPVPRMKPFIRCLMRMSLYQLLYMDTVPDSAVCNEACKLAAKRGYVSLRGFVNAVLRKLSREKSFLTLPDREKEQVQYLSVKYSIPHFIVELWLEEYGMDIAETLMSALMQIHPVPLRFRTDITEEHLENLHREIQNTGAVLVKSGYLPYSYTVTGGSSADRIPGFLEGLLTVQDVSSALAVEVADIKPRDYVIDPCAAPGGKTLLAAEKAAKVLSRDISFQKTELIRESAERMNAGNVLIQGYDAAVEDAALFEAADVVLLDVPCSGLGVIGKKRDIKYRITPEDMHSLQALQRRIVDTCSKYVKPGGTLIYSTCTINPGENEEMVRYITDHLPFTPYPLDEVLPPKLLRDKNRVEQLRKEYNRESRVQLNEDERRACIQLLPGYMEGDGFFIARFCRKPKTTVPRNHHSNST